MDTISYLLLRLALGASLFGHGLVRLPKLYAFSQWMISTFEKSLLPKMLVIPFSYGLPIIEFSVGLLLILGLFTKPSLLMGGLVMIALILGTTLIEQWENLPSQFMHIVLIAILFQFIESNNWAIDNLIKK